MTDDLRKDHDPRPNAEEREWMETDLLGYAARLVLVAGLAIMIGVSASVLLEGAAFTPVVATSPATAPDR